MRVEQGTVAAVSRNEVYAFTKPVRDEIVLVAGIGVQGDVHAGVHVRHRSRVRADATQPNLRQVHLMQAELFGVVGEQGFAVAPGELGENVTTSGIDLHGLPCGTILRFGAAESGGRAADDPVGVDGGPAGVGEGWAAGDRAVAGVLAAAAEATLDGPTAAAAAAVQAAAARDGGTDPRPAVILAGLRNPCLQIDKFQAGLLKELVGRDEQGKVVLKGGVMGVVLRGGAVRPGDAVAVELPPAPFAPLQRV
jgi:hypothetical protein